MTLFSPVMNKSFKTHGCTRWCVDLTPDHMQLSLFLSSFPDAKDSIQARLSHVRQVILLMSYIPRPASMQPSLKTYWLRQCSLLYCLGMVLWGKLSPLLWVVLTMRLSPTPKELTVPHPECMQTCSTLPTPRMHADMHYTFLTWDACRHAGHFLHPRNIQGSNWAAFPNRNAFCQESNLLSSCSHSETPSNHQSENPEVKLQTQGTNCYSSEIWSTGLFS